MASGRLGRIAASTGIVALTLGAGTLVATTMATATNPMTANANVNLRSGPSTSNTILDVVRVGQTVQATGQVQRGWYQVVAGSRTGWVYGSYLNPGTTTAPAPSTTAPTASGTVATTTNVNVRTGPGTSNAIVGVASKGTQLATTGSTSGGWVQVIWSGTARWIAGNYLTPVRTGTTAPAPTPLPTTTGKIRSTAALYLRTGGTLQSPPDGVLPAHSTVDATGRTTAAYSEIVHQGKVRWIATRYTVPVDAAPAPSVPTAPQATGAVWVNVGTLNVRATSAANGTIVGTVTRGQKLETTGVTTADRTQVIHAGVARWVYSPYVTTTAPAASDITIPAGITTSGISQLNANAKAVVQRVLDAYPRIRTIYGWRASSNYSSDHPNGRAVDIMIPNWTDPANADYGWTIAKDFATNARTYKVNYVIYRQSIFNAAYPERGWRPMEDRGDPTNNHYDHVHVSVFD